MTSHRPDRTTMEGMIWNANEVLEQAMNPGYNGVPKELFENAVGLVLISVVEAGFIFSGNVGTGIILAKQDDGSWSPPCACGLTGVGWGLLVGASLKDIMIFVNDRDTMNTLTGETGIKFGAQAEVTIGPFGRGGQMNLDLSGKGIGSTVSIAFSKGAFAGVNIEGAVTGPRNAVNDTFYGHAGATPRDILFNKAVQIPEGKITLIDEVYKKLDELSKGETGEADPSEESKKAAAKAEADKAAELANKQPDVVQVDAAAEAAKEQQSS